MFPIIFIGLSVLGGIGLYYIVLTSALLLPLLFLAGTVTFAFYALFESEGIKDQEQYIVLDDDTDTWIPIEKFQQIKQRPNVLIVEDDFEVALAAQTAFAELGCYARVVTTVQQAKELLSENSADIVILDWMLQNNVQGGQLLNELSQRRMMKNGGHTAKVVTYSSLSALDINFPKTENFQHFDHWQKPIRYAEFKERSTELLAASGF